MADLEWLDRYAGQTTEELLALEGEYRIDSLVIAFEQALMDKAERANGDDGVPDEELTVLSIEALEREINNGGYGQFLRNDSRAFSPFIVNHLKAIGCSETAAITQRALDTLRLPELSTEAIDAALGSKSDERDDVLAECDRLYFERPECIEDQLFSFIKANKERIRLTLSGYPLSCDHGRYRAALR